MDAFLMKRFRTLGTLMVVLVVVIVVLAALYGYHEFYTIRGGETVGFGRFTVFHEDIHSRYDAARTALGGWLESNGFAKVRKPSNYDPLLPDTGADVTWYKESEEGSYCFYVKVTHPVHSQGNGCGLEASVWWYTQGFSWKLDEQEKNVRAFSSVLATWWHNYRRDNPWWGWSDDGSAAKECCQPRNAEDIPRGNRKGN
jgi:hypothetical protein